MSIHRCGLFVGKLKLCVFGILVCVLLVAVPITMIDTLKKANKRKFSFLLIVTLKASLKLIPNFRIIQFKASILSDMIEAKEKIPRFYNQRWVVP
jgi:hypothetical protein